MLFELNHFSTDIAMEIVVSPHLSLLGEDEHLEILLF